MVSVVKLNESLALASFRDRGARVGGRTPPPGSRCVPDLIEQRETELIEAGASCVLDSIDRREAELAGAESVLQRIADLEAEMLRES
jgi:hypothetical protein